MDVDDDEEQEPVANKEEYQGFVLKINQHSLVGHINEYGCAEWDWGYVSSAVKLQKTKDFKYLANNKAEFQAEFANAQVSFGEFHYRGIDNPGEKGHTMESRAMLLMIWLVACRRQTSKAAKAAAISLVSSLITAMIGMTGEILKFHATIFGTDWQYHSQELVFEHGVTDDLGHLLAFHSSAEALWESLTKKPWNGFKAPSSQQK